MSYIDTHRHSLPVQIPHWLSHTVYISQYYSCLTGIRSLEYRNNGETRAEQNVTCVNVSPISDYFSWCNCKKVRSTMPLFAFLNPYITITNAAGHVTTKTEIRQVS